MKKLTILSIFDGISACQVALKNLGIEYDYYASEIDPYAIKVTQKNFPDTMQLGDIKNISFFRTNEMGMPCKYTNDDSLIIDRNNNIDETFIGKIELLCGGSPCQSFSIAGSQKGFEDPRGQLFWEYVRILNEVKPKFFIFENVNSMKQRDKDIISKAFGFEPIVINSSLLTAQQRKRLFYVGALQEDGTYKKVEIKQPQDKGILLKDILESGLPYQEKAHSLTASYSGAVFWNSIQKKQRSMIAEPIRLGHFNKGGQGDRIYSIQGKSVCLSANGGGRGANTGMYKIDLPDGDYNIRKLTVNECCRLQGFPDGFCDNISKSQGYKALGNSFTVPVIEHILKTILKK